MLNEMLTVIEQRTRIFLGKSPFAFAVAKAAYGVIRVDRKYLNYQQEQLRKKCYDAFEGGERIINCNYAGIPCQFNAISPKNYWHLKIGSQYELKLMERFFSALRDDDVILDIGGHVGMYSVPLAKVSHKGLVYVFEPEKSGYAAIVRNVELNKLGNVSTINKAVADKSGELSFFVRPDKDTHSIFEKTNSPSPTGVQEEYKVDVISIDEFVEARRIEPTVAKIDVEGAELHVLEGMRKTFSKLRFLIIECHECLTLEGYEDPVQAVIDKVRELGNSTIEKLDDCHIFVQPKQN